MIDALLACAFRYGFEYDIEIDWKATNSSVSEDKTVKGQLK